MSKINPQSPRLMSLAAEHRSLEAQIQRESTQAAPDFARVATLKKRKLALKDAIALLSRRAGAGAGGIHAPH